MSVKIVVIRIQAMAEKQKMFGFFFHTDCAGEKTPLPEVSLSRTKGKCIFPIDRLQEHDDHTPWHSNMDKANEYCTRVVDDIKAALTAKGIHYDIAYTDGHLEQPNPIEMLKASFAKSPVFILDFKTHEGKLLQQPPDILLSKLVVTGEAGPFPLGIPYVPN